MKGRFGWEGVSDEGAFRMKNKRFILGAAVFLCGLGVTLYPEVSNLWNSRRQEQLAQEYQAAVSVLNDEEKDALWEKARDYNANLTGYVGSDAFSEENDGEDSDGKDSVYQSLLNPAGDGVMGYLSIPKIDLYLPIYHGTGDESLSSGVGHLEGTSLPVGGEGTHAVLAGHRGLPSAALFTDLDWLEEGDVFYLYILVETLTYEVTGTEVTEPTETESLAIVPGEDLVTLVTCTPYGVNTQRLLVHASRVETAAEAETAGGGGLYGFAWMAYGLPAIAVLGVLLLALLLWIFRKKK
ncbi:MAG: class C sortase [Lachnospiraceae bacterium]|nr:class C sortase [Lachnospiraceae bacterium]